MTINDRLDEMQKRADAATAGPWERTRYSVVLSPFLDREYWEWMQNAGDFPATINDASFIAAARQDVPALIAEVGRLRQLCGNIHDRILRGAKDSDLLAMCDEANSDELTKLK